MDLKHVLGRVRRARGISGLVMIAALTLACSSAGSVQASPTDGVAGTATDACGGEVLPVKADGSQWACSFDDEFNGTAIDRTKWVVDRTASNGLHVGNACLVDDPRTVSVGGGVLNLNTIDTGTWSVCKSPNGGYSTPYIGGSVNTYGHFSQAYGRFEIRAKFPTSTKPGLQTSLWLFPVNVGANYYASAGNTGELDIAEYYTQYPDRVIPYAHYLPLNPWAKRTATTCKVAQPDSFHTYVLTWTRSQIEITYDGTPCLTLNGWVPLPPSAAPAPFNGPELIALTQSVGVGGNGPTLFTPMPANTQIDYVRVWQ